MKEQPTLKNMTEKQLKEWNKKLAELEQSNYNKDMTNKIQSGRGWIF